MRPRISIRGFVRPLVRWSIGPSVRDPFFSLGKSGGKWSKMAFHISAGSVFQSFTLNLSFNISHNPSLTILLTKSSFNFFFSQPLSQYFLYNFSFIIFPAQSFHHNFSFTIFLSQSFFQNLSFTIFLS